MSKVRMILATALVACMVAGVASASASAHEWKVEGKTITTPLALTSKAKTSFTLAPKTAGQFPTVVCTGLSSTGAKLLVASTGEATALTFSGCTVSSDPTHCEVTGGTITSAEITTKIASASKVEFTPKVGGAGSGTFATIKIKSISGKTCTSATTLEVKGQATGEDAAASGEALTHTAKFTTSSGSALTVLGGKEATLVGEAELTAAQKWSFL